jgi:membrane protease YdiL (CAAX protease family)
MLYITPLPQEKRIGWFLLIPAVVLPMLMVTENMLIKGAYYLALGIATVYVFRTFLKDSFHGLTGNWGSVIGKSIVLLVTSHLAVILINNLFLMFHLGAFARGDHGLYFLSNYDMYWLRVLPQSPMVGILLLVLIIPVTQEILLRGLFFNIFSQKHPWLAILITSVVFPLLHTLPYMGGCSTWQVILLFLQYVPAGFLLNIAYIATESVYAPMAIHVALKAYLFIFYL